MNDVPPRQDLPDDLDERYRRASGLDPSRPSESVRRAVLEHAAQLAAQRAAKNPSRIAGKLDSRRPAANRARWRPAIFGTLAAAALAGLLITPRFLTPRAPSSAPSSGGIPAARASLATHGRCERASAGVGADADRWTAVATARRSRGNVERGGDE